MSFSYADEDAVPSTNTSVKTVVFPQDRFEHGT
jgi:hypothetical protein